MRKPKALAPAELVVEPEQQERDDRDERDGRVLLLQVGGCALLHGAGDLLHALVARPAGRAARPSGRSRAAMATNAQMSAKRTAWSWKNIDPAFSGITKSLPTAFREGRDPASGSRRATGRSSITNGCRNGHRWLCSAIIGDARRAMISPWCSAVARDVGRLPRRARVLAPVVVLVAAAIAVPSCSRGGARRPLRGVDFKRLHVLREVPRVRRRGAERRGRARRARPARDTNALRALELPHARPCDRPRRPRPLRDDEEGRQPRRRDLLVGLHPRRLREVHGEVRRRAALRRGPDALRAASGRPLRVRLLQLPARHRPRRDDPLRQRPVQGPAVLRRPRRRTGSARTATPARSCRTSSSTARCTSPCGSTRTTPIYPCNAVEDQYKIGLLPDADLLHPPRVSTTTTRRGSRSATAIEEDFVSTCYVSMGRDISGNSHREARRCVERCSLGDPDFQEWCFVGATRNAVFHDHGTKNADALCAIVPERYRPRCEPRATVRPRACDDAEASSRRPHIRPALPLTRP